MVSYVAMIVLGTAAFLLAFFIMKRHEKKRENRLMNTLQDMLDAAMAGKLSEISFNETKLSYLENSMRHYLLSQGVIMETLHQQKNTIQRMITDISHQSTTPISNILLYTELLEEQGGATMDGLLVIKEEARKLDFLIQSLVKSARLETGMIGVNPREEDINLLFQGIQNQYGSIARGKNISLEIEPVSLKAQFDLKWTMEALSNIVDNAIKYTDEGGTITIRAIPYQIFVRIDIVDTGMGIGEEEQNKIFLRFYRSLEVEKISGAGIGLYLSREIIQMERGYIKVASKRGMGSKFSVFLPL